MGSTAMATDALYNWVDITGDFFDHIKALDLGELMHDGVLFGLFEAMSAIEMMDPKMDAGMLCNRGSPKPLNFNRAVEAEKLKVENLNTAELIGVMDSTMACIATWLEGHSLAQTVFTNLYLHQPHQIKDKTLKSYCIAVYKLIEAIKDCINKAQVVEEEDFQPMSYGYRLGANPQAGNSYDPSLDVTDAKCIAALREQEEFLNKSSKRHSDEKEIQTALAARVRFMRMFLQVMVSIIKRDHDSNSGDCEALLNGCSDLMKTILRTVDLGTQPEENSDAPNPMGFEPMVNQRLLPPTFPRYTKIKKRSDALQYFDELISRLRHAWKITSCKSYHVALDFFTEFSRGKSCVVSRSVLQLLWPYPGGNAVNANAHNAVLDSLRHAIRTFVAPPIYSNSKLAARHLPAALLKPMNQYNPNEFPTPNAKEFAEAFLNRCVRPFAVLLQIYGHNRARQRDKLALVLEEFIVLQEEADSVDAVLGSDPRCACFGTWILYHVLRVMIAYLLSGLELELYSVHEYHYIYWYLYEFLYGWQSSALSRAEAALNTNMALLSEEERSRRKKRARANALQNHQQLLCQVHQAMSGGYFKALIGFRNQGKIRSPSSEFDNEAVRYKHRFSPIVVLPPPPHVRYHEYKDMMESLKYESPLMLYVGGCKHFQQARTLLETITTPDKEIQDLIKICKTNFVVLKLLAGGHKQDSSQQPEFDFTVHRHFPIIKLP